MHQFSQRLQASAVAVALLAASATLALAEPIHHITVDGQFDDWTAVPSYFDPTDDQHDTDHDGPLDVPAHVNHSDVDLLEYKFTHDSNNLYAYFRSRGAIGATQNQSAGQAGRYYVILTIDVDDDDVTGYPIHEGGYYPTSDGYDMNMEIEYYNGSFNTGHYLNHGALAAADLPAMEAQQKQGIVDVRPGVYDHYTQWVMFDDPSAGDHDLGDGSSITFVQDRGPVHQGIIRASISPDGHEIEMVAPFAGFMSYPGANPGERGGPIIDLGKTIDVSFSLEASGELHAASGSGVWGSDTANPIIGYQLQVPEPSAFAMTLVGMAALVCCVNRNEYRALQALDRSPTPKRIQLRFENRSHPPVALTEPRVFGLRRFSDQPRRQVPAHPPRQRNRSQIAINVKSPGVVATNNTIPEKLNICPMRRWQ